MEDVQSALQHPSAIPVAKLTHEEVSMKYLRWSAPLEYLGQSSHVIASAVSHL